MKRIDHIGIAVKDLDKALEFYQKILSAKPDCIEEVRDMKVRTAKFRVGELSIELIESLDAEGTVARFIKKRGEGIHHICLEVEDIEKATNELKRKGIKPVFPEAKPGSEGTLINFIPPKNAAGVLIELAEHPK